LYEELSGTVRARNQVVIRPEISAPVVEVLAQNGDRVTQGQPLVRLAAATQREQLRQAESGLQIAEATAAEARAREAEIRANVVRLRALAGNGLVSELDLETREAQLLAAAAQASQAEARVGQARANIAEQQSALDRTLVRAPVAGHVGQRAAEVGMVVGPNTVLFVLGDMDDLVVEVPLTQEMLGQIQVGTPAEIGARGSESNALRARVSRISPFLDQSSFSTVAEIDISSSGTVLSPGMFVEVRLLRGETEPATLVPASAVWEDARTGTQLIFVVDDSAGLVDVDEPGDTIPDQPRRVSPRRVQLLAEGRGRTGVSGIAEGEWVVTVGQHILHERLQAADTDGMTTARVRPVSWRRVLELQGLQREDLLEGFLAKQRRVAAVMGAEMPTSTEQVERLLAAEEGRVQTPDSASAVPARAE
jgi:RND family efflux transporter MFP subunit